MNQALRRILGLMGAVLVLTGCARTESGFVGSATCGSCHADAYAAWETSDHMRAMELPTSANVLGNFDDQVFEHFGDTYIFTKRDSSYIVVANGDSLEVAYTFGFDPLQQLLLPAHGGRLQALTVAWDAGQKRWYSLYPDEPTPEGDPLNWKSAHLNWNYMCADCHSTGLKRGYDLESDSYETTWEEMTVGCESCHGPGRDHANWADSPKGDDPYGTPVKEAVVPGVGRTSLVELEREVNMCASCHARRVQIQAGQGHDEDFIERFSPSLLEDSLYFADGQIRDEVYVYGSFLQSKMAQKGVACSDCHEPHSGQIRLPGNALCSSCHEAETYDTALHTGHDEVGGTGEQAATQCVTCHMPERTYMGIDARRDHRFGVPEPLVSKRTGSPDVCASCHAEKTPEWAAQQIATLRTRSSRPDRRPNHYALAVAGLSEGDEGRFERVQLALRDSLTAPIQKGSLLSRLGADPSPESVRMVVLGLSAPDIFERVGALRALSGWAGLLPVPDLSSLLRDSSRWVRIEAVATALAFGQTDWSSQQDAAVLQEYIDSQNAVAERPEVHINLGRLYESLGRQGVAGPEFETAVRLDSTSADTWLELALFTARSAAQSANDPLRQVEMRQKAEQTFGKAASFVSPRRSDILYLFGLFLAEDRTRLPDAATVLRESARLDMLHPRKAYNAGLAYQQMGEAKEAEWLLEQAIRAGSEDASEALVILYMQSERWEDALKLNTELLAEYPDRSDVADRQEFIESQLR